MLCDKGKCKRNSMTCYDLKICTWLVKAHLSNRLALHCLLCSNTFNSIKYFVIVKSTMSSPQAFFGHATMLSYNPTHILVTGCPKLKLPIRKMDNLFNNMYMKLLFDANAR